jgi:hypothetical protein
MDWRDALHILQFLLEDRFLQISISLPAEGDVRQPLRRPHKRVYFRTSVKDRLQAQAMWQGIRQIFRLNNLEAR